MPRFFLHILTGVLTVPLLFFSCAPGSDTILEREARFELGIGRLEDELGLFTRDGVLPKIPNTITMRDGIVYISNGQSNKIMGFTSYGDLIRLIYDTGDNPRPVTLGTDSRASEDALLTRRAVAHPFNRLGKATVDSRRYIYAEDALPQARSVWDDDLGVTLDRVVLRFDNAGNAIDYIGQEGVGGVPFPRITRLMTTAGDDLVVVSRTNDAHFAHMYSPLGDLITTVEIGHDRLPVPAGDGGYVPVLNDIVVGADGRRMYVKVSYYRALRDTASARDQGISFEGSRIYWVDLHTGRYEGYVETPRGTGEESRSVHFELLGVARGDHFFLLSRDDEIQSQLVIMNDTGRVLRRRKIQIPERNLVMRDFYLDHAGVLTALLAYPDRAFVVWWRSDRLLPGS